MDFIFTHRLQFVHVSFSSGVRFLSQTLFFSYQVFLTLSEENESTGQQSLGDISQMVRERLTSSSPQHSTSPINSNAQNGQVPENNQEGFALDAVEVRYV